MNPELNGTVVAAEAFPNGFESYGYKVGNVLEQFPAFSGIRIMMMPFYIHDADGSLPASLDAYKPMLKAMLSGKPDHVESYEHTTAYLTIDEMFLEGGTIQRKPGLHVDGMYNGELSGAWGGGGGGGWGSVGNGMLLVSNTNNLCSMWVGHFDGVPVNDGDCEHLRPQLDNAERFDFQAGDVIWADGLLVHESFAPTESVHRQFVRISLPNNAPWFKGYTENPLGILPCGDIIDAPRI